MPVPDLSVDEIIYTLKHSSLPTVLCEGRTDMSVLRYVEEKLEGLSFLSCGGRDKLLGVFARRREAGDLPLVFFADQDNWIFTGIPAVYDCVIFTWGYSIENDLIEGAGLERLLGKEEKSRFEFALSQIIRWFAFEIQKLPAGTPITDVSVSRVLVEEADELSERFLAEIGFSEPSLDVVNQIQSSYQRLLRGKIYNCYCATLAIGRDEANISMRISGRCL